MLIDQIIANIGNTGHLLTVIAIIASWTTFDGGDKIRGPQAEKIIFSLSNVTFALCWLILIMLLSYSVLGKDFLFYCSYFLLVGIAIVQFGVSSYFYFSKKLVLAKKREENIDQNRAKDLGLD